MRRALVFLMIARAALAASLTVTQLQGTQLQVAQLEVTIRLGEASAPGAQLAVTSSTRGSDALECLREGEWSVGQVSITASSAGDDELTLRIVGGASQAPIPALVRRGPVRSADGKTEVRETYIRTAHREGSDVVAHIPFPPVPGVEDRYDLVDQSTSVEWLTEPHLEADPADREPLGKRHLLVLVPGDDDAFNLLRKSPALHAALATHKPFVFRYPAYRSARENAAALVKLIRAQAAAGQAVLVAQGSGAAVMHQAAGALGRRVAPAAGIGLAGFPSLEP